MAGQAYNKAKAPEKVDAVIIFNLFELGRMTSKQYTSSSERRFKYMAIKDHILLSIDPLLIPRVKGTEAAWATRYKELIEQIKEHNIEYTDVDTFFDLLQKFLQLFATVMYSSGYYELENIDDNSYERHYMQGKVTADGMNDQS